MRTLLAICLLVCVSCDPVLDYKQIIVNHSAETLKWQIQSSDLNSYIEFPGEEYYYNEDSSLIHILLKVPPQSEKLIFYISGIRQVYDIDSCHCDYNIQFIDSMYSIKKDILNPTDWKLEIIEESNLTGGGIVECKFEISENDLVKKE